MSFSSFEITDIEPGICKSIIRNSVSIENVGAGCSHISEQGAESSLLLKG